jgi:hypothetical protein
MTEGKPPHDAHIIHMSWDNTYGYDAQIAISNADPPQAWIRGGTTGNWGGWTELQKVSDTGWVTLSLNTHFSQVSWNPLRYRRYNNIVTIVGAVTIDTASTWNMAIATLPVGCRPVGEIDFVCRNSNASRPIVVAIGTNGNISLLSTVTGGTAQANDGFFIFATFIVA